MRKTAKLVALAAVVALTVTACGDRPDDETDSGSEPTAESSESTPTEEAPPTEEIPANFKACMVSDSGGFDDKSFNQTSHDGLENAVKELGLKTAEVESQSDSEYTDNVNALLDAKCNVIVTVGFLLAAATEKAAKANKDVDFAIVDNADVVLPNVKPLTFETASPSFMAGYLAAGMTQTGIVGTLGGAKIPTVTIFMDGYWEGVQYWNEQKDDDVQVVGWDENTQEGSFTDDFEDKIKGQTTAENMISQGADIILPVAGPAGLGSLEAVQSADGDVNAIWVDSDGCESAAEFCDVLMTSVTKGMDIAVDNAITDSATGTFDNAPYVGTLENDGVGIAPFHEFEDEIPQELKDELEQIRSDLIDGTIEITSPSAPK